METFVQFWDLWCDTVCLVEPKSQMHFENAKQNTIYIINGHYSDDIEQLQVAKQGKPFDTKHGTLFSIIGFLVLCLSSTPNGRFMRTWLMVSK